MRIIFNVYKKSALATFMSAGGSVCFATGIAALFAKEFIPGIILILVGIGLVFGAGKVNDVVVKHKLEKSLKDPKLIGYVQQSTLAAYSLYKNNPTVVLLDFIGSINPYAAAFINQYRTNQISESALISMLTAYDTQNGSIVVWPENKLTLYQNSMFRLDRVTDVNSEEAVARQKKIKRNETKKAVIVAVAIVLAFCAFTAMIILIPDNGSKNDDSAYPTTAIETDPTECPHKYEETVITEAGYGVEGKIKRTCSECGRYEYESIEALPSIFNLKVTDKQTRVDNYYEGDVHVTKNYISFFITVENISDKDIEKFKGVLNVKCGKYDSSFNVDFDSATIPANQTVEIGVLEWGYNVALEMMYYAEEEIYKADYSELTFNFVPTEVVVAE